MVNFFRKCDAYVFTRGGVSTQEYPEGHSTRVEQDSQNIDNHVARSSRKKEKRKSKALFGSAFIDGFRCRAAESEPKGEPSRIRFQKSAAKI